MTTDERLAEIDEKKRKLCAEFRRKLSALLNEEQTALGLVTTEHEIEIYY